MAPGVTSSLCEQCHAHGRVNDGDPFADADDEGADRGLPLRGVAETPDADEAAMHGLGREDDEAFYGGSTCEGEF